MVLRFLSVSGVLTAVFAAYIAHSLWSMYKIYYPSVCPPTESNCLKPSWDESSRFRAAAFISTSKKINSDQKLSWASEDFNVFTSIDVRLNISLPRATIRNGTLYLHVFLTESTSTIPITSIAQFDLMKSTYKHAAITKYVVPKSKAFNLLGASNQNAKDDLKTASSSQQKPVTHWIPRLSIHIMSESKSLISVPPEMFSYMKFNRRRQYYPMLYIDHFGILEKDFWPVNKSNPIMPLTLSYVPVSFGKMRLMIIVEHSLKMLESFGFSDKERDDVKAIFFDTNIYLLFLTFVVSGFHLLFDILAFKNDISFWRRRKSIVGLSFRSLVWRCVSQSIVFVYLYDQGTSAIVLVPASISIIIELWKVTKALKLKIHRSGWRLKIEFGRSSNAEKQSDAYDSQGMKYLMIFILPCCLIYAFYSLLYAIHISWFSWCLESVVSGVYAFGFIFMLPQLFVNYKLKSVAHLPWRAFMYKAFNTVVDDLFAFIITMPTAHRIACFRDDIVFIVYLYQRWLYPVDQNRITEYAEDQKEKDD